LLAKAISKLSKTGINSVIRLSFENLIKSFLSSSERFLKLTKSAFALCQPSRYSCFSARAFVSLSFSFLNTSGESSRESSSDIASTSGSSSDEACTFFFGSNSDESKVISSVSFVFLF
jgi:hypothetical protein